MHQVDLRTSMYNESVPDAWFTLYKGKPDRVEKTSQFCSLTCLNSWLAPQLVEPDPNTLYPDMLLSGPYPEKKEDK
jgi:hypothetical protein